MAAVLFLTAACVTDRSYAPRKQEPGEDASVSTSSYDAHSASSDDASEATARPNDSTSNTQARTDAGVLGSGSVGVTGSNAASGAGDAEASTSGNDSSFSNLDVDAGARDSGITRDHDGSPQVEPPQLVSVVATLDVDTLHTMDERAVLTVWCQYDADEPVQCTNRASIDIADPTVVSLNDAFELQPLTNGSTSIVASVEGLTSEPTALVVDVGPVCTTLHVSGAATSPAGTSVQWTAACDFDDGSTDVDVSELVAWSSNPESIAPISEAGLITADTVGGTTITASFNNPDRTTALVSRSFTVTNGELVAITISAADDVTIPQGKTAAFLAECEYTDVSSDCTTDVTWVSSSPLVATIDQNGVASANETGTSVLWANVGDISSNSIEVSVTQPVLSEILLSPNSAVTLEVNTSRQLTATCVMSNATSSNCTSQATWNSSEPTIAVASEGGSLAGITDGTTLITATLDGVVSSAVTATIVPPPGCENAIEFPDEVMLQDVRGIVGKAAGAIYYEDVKSVTYFEHNQLNGYLEFLNGIECFTSLESLTVQRAWLADLSPIVGLVHLTNLNVAFTSVWSVPDLSLLTQLTTVDVGYTEVYDLYSFVAAEHFAEGDSLNLTGSALDCTSDWALEQIAELEARGVAVAHHCL